MLKLKRGERCDGAEKVKEQETIWQIVGIFEETLAEAQAFHFNIMTVTFE